MRRPLFSRPGAVATLALIAVMIAIFPLSLGNSPQPVAAQGATDAATPASAAMGEPVPIYRGDAARTGVMPGPAPEGAPDVLWRAQASSEVRTGIVVGSELVYAGSEDGFVTAFEIETGAERWTFDTGAPEGSPFSVFDGDRLFVAGSDGHARALDALTGEVIWTSPDDLLLGIAVVPGDDVLYVGGIDPYFVALSKVDGSLVWQADLPAAPGGRSPVYLDGTLYTGLGDGQLVALNGTDGSLLWATATGDGGVGSIASHDGLIIGPASYEDAGGYLFAVDAESGELLWTVEGPEGWSPATGYGDLVIAQGQGGTWQGLSQTDGSFLGEFAPPEPLEPGGPVSIVGDTAYLTGRDGVLYAVDVPTGESIWEVTLDGEMNYSPAITGGRIYVGTWAGNVYALGASTDAATPVADPATPAAGGDSDWITTQWNGRINVLRRDGSDQYAVPTDWTGGGQLHPDWSPTGEQIAFSVDDSDGTRDIWIVNADGSDAREIFDCASPCAWTDHPAWSPDGLSIAFDHTDSDNGANDSSIRVLTLADESMDTVARVSEPTDVIWTPRWSADGQYLVFEVARYAEPTVTSVTVVASAVGMVSLAADPGDVRWLTGWDAFAHYPDWNPVDDRIVFTMRPSEQEGEAFDLFTIMPDGTGLTRITNLAGTGYQGIQPTWQSDGVRVIFVKDQMWTNPVVAEIRLDGPTPSAITEFPFQGTHPRASPAGRATTSTAAPVTMYRGDPARTGVMPGPGPASQPEVLWTVQTGGEVSSAPALVDGVLYIGSNDGNVYALDAQTGAERWQYAMGSPVSSSPAVIEGLVIVGSESGDLVALDAVSGAEVWTAVGARDNASAAVVDGVVYTGGRDQRLYAFNLSDGTVKWQVTLPANVSRSLAVADGTLFAGCDDGNLYAIDGTDGHTLWSFSTGFDLIGTPAVADGTVYFAPRDDSGGALFAVDTATGAERWRYTTPTDAGVAPPVVHDGIVFAADFDGIVHALDAATGTQSWEYATGAADGITAAPAVVGTTLYVGDRNETITALDTASGQVNWQVAVDGPVDFGPTVTGGMLYLGTLNGAIQALGVPTDAR